MIDTQSVCHNVEYFSIFVGWNSSLSPRYVIFLSSSSIPAMCPTSVSVHLLLAFWAVPRNSSKVEVRGHVTTGNLILKGRVSLDPIVSL